MTYPGLDGERPSIEAWRLAARYSAVRAAVRRREAAVRRRDRLYAFTYGLGLAVGVIVADSAGAPGLL